MKYLLHCFFVLFTISTSNAQIVLINVEDDRYEISKAIEYINSNSPNMIGVNIYFDCIGGNADSQLSQSLVDAQNVMMRTELRFFLGGVREFKSCPGLYPYEVNTGFINILDVKKDENIFQAFQVKNVSSSEKLKYHFAVMLAFSLDFEKTISFVEEQDNIVNINFEKKRSFEKYSINEFYEDKLKGEVLKDKIIILSVLDSNGHDLIMTDDNQYMSSSEVFANIACQIVDE